MQNSAATASGLEMILAIWHRRKWLMLPILFVLFPITVMAVRRLPNVYESTATLLVTQPVSERFVGPSVIGELETRLQTTSREILSRSRLNELIDRFGLYPDRGEPDTAETLAERMRKDIRIEFAEVHERMTGRDAPVAFTVKYRGRDPDTVADVTNALAALYVQRSTLIREQQATNTLEFLQSQLDEAKRTLSAREQQVSEYKARHSGELPEQQPTNLAMMERLNAQIRLNIDNQLRLMDRRDELVRQGGGAMANGTVDDLSARLAKLRQDLADMRMRYTDEHPDIIRLKSEIADLERQLAMAPSRSGSPAAAQPPSGRRPTGALAQVDAELAALKSEEQSLRRAIADYQRRIENSPQRETEYQQLARDVASARDRYQSLLQRYQDAQISQRMEQGKQGDEFRVLDPAVPAARPVSPHRARLMLVGLVLSAGIAGGAAMLSEARDTSFHTVDDLRAFTSVPVLVSIPPIITLHDKRLRRLRISLATIATAVAVVAILKGAVLLRSGFGLIRLLTTGRL